MNKATCRGCGAPIVWIKTPAGKAMPCDPAPVYYKATPDGKDKVVTTRGEVVSCEIVPGANATDAGYRPHSDRESKRDLHRQAWEHGLPRRPLLCRHRCKAQGRGRADRSR